MRSFESFAEQVTELDPRHYNLQEAKKESDRKDAMPKDDVGHDIHRRAVAQYNKQNPSKKVRVDEAAPIVAKLAAGAAGKLAGKGIAKATAGQAAKGGLRKRAADYATRKGSEMAYDKVKEKLTDNGDVSEEVVQEDDMKGMSVKSGHKRSAK